jgi:hypothetical protein
MAYRRHIRMTCLGSLPGGDMFSFGLSLGHLGLEGEDAGVFEDNGLAPNSSVWDDLAQDVAEFWSGTNLSDRCRLTLIKFAKIGPDGLYAAAPIERFPGGNALGIAGNFGGPAMPNQVALACTLHTAGDLGRVKGRFYLPMPAIFPEGDGRISENNRDVYETRVRNFVNDINDQPGLDVLNLRVVVASQGRRNKDGSLKAPPRNYDVTAVSVGRTLDTVRRRRNKVAEFRGTPSDVS